MKKSVRNPILLFICAFLWGSTFVAQSIAGGTIDAFTFLFCRSFVAVIFLTVVIFGFDRVAPSAHKPATREDYRLLIQAGVCSGLFLFGGSYLQQKGIETTTAGKAGFITAFYIILVPLVGIFFKKKIGPLVWIALFSGILGLYFLCMTSADVSISGGDFLILLGAFCYTGQILVIDHFAPLVDGIRMSRIQFIVLTFLCLICMFVFEEPTMEIILLNWGPILYAGCLSSGIAYTLQIIGQVDVNPTVASLIMSFESVFSVLTGWLVLHENLSGRELLGCLLMCVAIVLAQIPTPAFLTRNKNS